MLHNFSFRFLFLCLPTISHASNETLTLPKLLESLNAAPQIQQIEQAQQYSKWSRIESQAQFFPNISATGSHLFSKKYALIDVTFPGASSAISIPQIIPSTSYSLNLQWTLFNGFSNIEQFRSSLALERASNWEVKWQYFRLKHEATLLFYQALTAKLLKEVAIQNLKTLEDHLQDARNMRRSGESTNYEVLRVEVQTSEAQNELLKAQDDIAIALMRLSEALGRDLEVQEIDGQLPIIEPNVLQNPLPAQTKTIRADIQALENRIEAHSHSSSSRDRHWIPSIGLFGQFTEYNNRSDTLFNGQDFRSAYNFGIQFTWSLFSGFADYSRQKQAAALFRQSEKILQINLWKARTDAEIWRRRFLYYSNVLRSRGGDVRKAEESVRLAKAGRKAGLRTSTDLLDAELELFKARAGQVNAQMGTVEALINYELATGQNLYEFK